MQKVNTHNMGEVYSRKKTEQKIQKRKKYQRKLSYTKEREKIPTNSY